MIVDDDLHVRCCVQTVLRRYGFEVCCAADGDEARLLIQQQRPDLIITDLAMPRLNGWELAARLQGNTATADIPIIAISGRDVSSWRDTLETRAEIGVCLSKPFSFRRLAELCKQMLESNPGPTTA